MFCQGRMSNISFEKKNPLQNYHVLHDMLPKYLAKRGEMGKKNDKSLLNHDNYLQLRLMDDLQLSRFNCTPYCIPEQSI